MDVRDFATFLKERLLEKADEFNEVLYSVSYGSLEEGQRIAGRRETLVSVANSIGSLIKEFYERND